MKRVAVTTLGCKVNQYDSASLAADLRREGYELQGFEPGADVYVVNSCTVTDRADAESRQLVRRVKRWNPAATVIMTGCYAQANPRGAAAIGEVDFVIGLSRRSDLLRIIGGNSRRSSVARVLISDLRKATTKPSLGAEAFDGRTRASLKVQDGCNLFCGFCIVPWSRGRSRSVPPRDILRELDKLARAGFQEVVLTGIHLGGYGQDLRPKVKLADLVEMVADRASVPRVRLSSIDPPELNRRLLEIMRRSDVLCEHLHVPVQACDDAVLRRMRRHYDGSLVRDVVAEIRRQLPEAGLGTDVIAGFPGETEAEFGNTLDMLETLSFTYLHVFPYSRRVGTAAAQYPDQLPKPLIALRARRLRTLGDRKRSAFAGSFVGRTLRVLPEGDASADGPRSGYARNYVRVTVQGERMNANREVVVRIRAVREARAEGVLDTPG